MILIVDDEIEIVNLITKIFQKNNLACVSARDGEEALEILREQKPKAILLDLMMPKMDGFEVLKRIKKDPELSSIPVIVCSSLNDRESREQAQSLGADQYVTKPFRAAELVSVVGQLAKD